jgi:hypothetical protein
LVGSEFSEYYNGAYYGMGNRFIQHAVYEADSIKQFTPNDTVMVMMTSTPRVDSFLLNGGGEFGWDARGAVYQPNNQHQLGNLLHYWSWEQGFLETYLAAKSIKTLLEARGVKHQILLGIDWGEATTQGFNPYDGFKQVDHPLVKQYMHEAYDLLDVKESFYLHSKQNHSEQDYYHFDLPKGKDDHPTIMMSLSYIKEHLPQYCTEYVQSLAEQLHRQIDFSSHNANWKNPNYRRLRGVKLGTTANLTYYLDRPNT